MSDNPKRLLALQPFWGLWTLDAELGDCDGGKVYRVRCDENGQRFYAALKWRQLPRTGEAALPLVEGSELEQTRARMERMRAMSACEHLAGCKQYMLKQREDQTGWDLLILMELLTPLSKVYDRGLKVGHAVQLGLDITAAIEECNGFGVVHGAIAPDNLYINAKGNYLLGHMDETRLEAETQPCRSPFYRAPECETSRSMSGDLYSLGLILYQLLNAQRLPFVPLEESNPSPDVYQLALNLRLHGTPLLPPAQGGEALTRVILKACQPRPQDRYQTPAEMREALVAAAQTAPCDQPLRLSPINGPAQRTTEPFQSVTPQKPVVAPPAPFQRAYQEPASSPAKGKSTPWLMTAVALLCIAGVAALLMTVGVLPMPGDLLSATVSTLPPAFTEPPLIATLSPTAVIEELPVITQAPVMPVQTPVPTQTPMWTEPPVIAVMAVQTPTPSPTLSTPVQRVREEWQDPAPLIGTLIITKHTNVYFGPGRNTAIVGAVNQDEQYDCLQSDEEGWYWLIYPRSNPEPRGYIPASCATLEEGKLSDQSMSYPILTLFNDGDELKAYQQASESAKRAGTVPSGAIVDCVAVAGENWYAVILPLDTPVIAYVHSDQLVITAQR